MRIIILITLSYCYAFMSKNIYAKLNILKIQYNDKIITVQPISFINNHTNNSTDLFVESYPKYPPKFPTLTLSNIAFLLIEI